MDAEIQAFLTSLESQPDYSINTRLAYRSDLLYFENYLSSLLKRPPSLGDFSAPNITGFLGEERKNGRRQSTLLRRRATLRRFEAFLIHDGYLKSGTSITGDSAVDQIVSPIVPKEPLLFLNEEQVQHLWDCLAEGQRPLTRRDYAILAVLLETGMSVSMLIALNIYELDMGAGKIHMCDSMGRDLWLPLGRAIEPINLYIKHGRPELNSSSGEPALFISQVGTRMSRQSVWQVLRHWGEIAHLPVTLSPRLIRHTAAVHLLQTGRPVTEIQSLLGHSNPLSTQALLHRLKAATRAG